MYSDRKGFTLIELIIVVIIIGILASIAAPMLSSMQRKAIITEAVMGLGRIRESVREYYVEYGCYPPGGACIDLPFSIYLLDYSSPLFPGLRMRPYTDATHYGASDLDGTYFSQECYSYWAVGGGGSPNTYGLRCDICWNGPGSDEFGGTASHAPKRDDTFGKLWPEVVAVEMDDKGNVQTQQAGSI